MKKLIIISSIALFSAVASAQMQDSTSLVIPDMPVEMKKPSQFGIAIGASASTNGLGASVITAFNNRVSLRLSYEKVDMALDNISMITDYLKMDFQGKSYQLSPVWKTGGMSAIFDFYLSRGFYVSLGAVLTDMDISITGRSVDSINVGDIVYYPDEIGEFKLTFKPEKKLAPYAGIGFGRNISRDHRLAMSLELGAYYYGSTKVAIDGTNFLAPIGPENESVVEKLEAQLKDKGFFPVLKLGLSYKIFKGGSAK